MIRNFELFCKLNQIKISELLLFEKTITSCNPEIEPCPSCGAKASLRSHCSYERYLIYLADGAVITETVIVPRFQCTCGHTHALLPACLIPYGSYSLFFILTVLRAYFLRHKTVEALCASFDIAISTLYAWIKLFRSHKALWLGVLADSTISCPEFLTALFDVTDFLRCFFLRISFSFLQGIVLTTPSRRSDISGSP